MSRRVIATLEHLGFKLLREGNHISMIRVNPDGTSTPLTGIARKHTNLFSSLRTNKGRGRYPTVTSFRALHKPFLLLSAMDLIA